MLFAAVSALLRFPPTDGRSLLERAELVPFHLRQGLAEYRCRPFRCIGLRLFQCVVTGTTPVNPLPLVQIIKRYIPAFWNSENEEPDAFVS